MTQGAGGRGQVPVGYESGPGAPVRAYESAVARTGDATTLVLVEGISDQIAVETAASALGWDLAAAGAVVVPIGGAHAVGRVLRGRSPGAGVVGLCDRREEPVVRRALEADGRQVRSRADLAACGFFVCEDDLEDELVRAVGVGRVETLVGAEGDLRAFRSLQAQPAWRGHAPDQQLRRFLGSGGSRKLRYARLLVHAAVERGALPVPLTALLDAATRR